MPFQNTGNVGLITDSLFSTAKKTVELERESNEAAVGECQQGKLIRQCPSSVKQEPLTNSENASEKHEEKMTPKGTRMLEFDAFILQNEGNDN